jgi:hypothetical protein
MSRLATAVLIGAAMAVALAVSAFAASTYVGPKQWSAGQGAGSTYSSNWTENNFSKYGSGYDTTVTFIDNVSYGWHATVRNTSSTTHTFWSLGGTKRGHCLAHVSGFWGSCWVN